MRATIEAERSLQQEPTKTVQLDGAHLGGTDHANLLISKLDVLDQRPSVAVDVFDPQRHYAETVAGMFRRRGIPAKAHAKSGPASHATIHTLAIDKGQDIAAAVGSPMTNDMVTAGLVVSIPTFQSFGGFVIGLGATLTRTANDIRPKVGAPFIQLGRMAPERRSSRNTTELFLHTKAMMNKTRHQTHDRLTTSAVNLLQNGTVESELFAVDGSNGNEYQLDVIETQRSVSRMGLVNMATQDVLPSMPINSRDGRGGVVFLDPDDEAGWLYLVLCQNRGASWAIDHTIEIPVPAVSPVTLPVMPRRIIEKSKPTPKAEPTFLEVFLTD